MAEISDPEGKRRAAAVTARRAAAPAVRQRAVIRTVLAFALALAPFSARAGVARLTLTPVSEAFPQINRSGQLAWQEIDPLGSFDPQIDLWDGTAIRRLSHNFNRNSNPQINDAGQVVWVVSGSGVDAGLHLWNGVMDRILSPNGGVAGDPQINSAGQVVWEGNDGYNPRIYLWDGI